MENTPIKDKITINITGMHCASCVNRIEKALINLDGVHHATVNLVTKKATVIGDIPFETLYKTIEGLGFGVIKEESHPEINPCFSVDKEQISPQENKTWSEKQRHGLGIKKRGYDYERNKFIYSAILTCPVFFISMLSIQSPFPSLAQFLLTTIVLFCVGFGFIERAFLQARYLALGMDSLISLGSGAAYCYSIVSMVLGHYDDLYFETSAMIITLILFGRYLESKTKHKAGEAIKGLMELMPTSAHVIREGIEMEIPLSEIIVGDKLIIRPGEKIPVDGMVIEGQANINESMLTGEGMPVYRKKGDEVFSGAINTNGAITIEAKKVGAETFISRIIKTVEEAQATKAPVQRIADRVSGIFVPIVIGIAGLTLFVWLILGFPFIRALIPSVAVLVIACPCALGLATPVAIMVGIGRAAKEGILIKNASSLELVVKTDILVFDKTGTLTEGKPTVSEIYTMENGLDDELLEIIGACEMRSEHPLARAATQYVKEKGIIPRDIEDFVSFPGSGIQARYRGKYVLIGNEEFMYKNNIDIALFELKTNRIKGDGNARFFVAINGVARAVIGFSDTIRETSMPAIEQLKTLDIMPVMLTGDNNEAAELVARMTGITHFKARLSPEDKIKAIKGYKNNGDVVAMVGDGINDAPALAAADVSFAIGTGTDISMESADITLVKGDITKVVKTVNLSKEVMRIIRQNLFWAFCYNLIAIPIAALGMLNPMIAAGAMAMSSVSVVTNSLRLRKMEQ